MSHKTKVIDIDRIYIDSGNPRHDPIENEADIIAHLIAEEKVKPLASHIAKAGSTSPLELIGVFPHPSIKDAYISVEGNRRMCALKLLHDPEKANTEANRRHFRNLSDMAKSKIDKISVVVFKDRKTADQWVSLRHEGEQGGVGTRPWDADQKTRFNMKGSHKRNPNIQAVLLKDYALKEKLLSEAEMRNIAATTLTRYLGNPTFRETIGLHNHQDLAITVPKAEFDVVVTRFLKDASAKRDVHSRTKAEDRKRYASSLHSNGVAPTTRGLPPQSPEVPRITTGTPPRKRNNPSPDARKTIIPSSFTVQIADPVLKRLYDELRRLDADEYTFAATYLFRAVLEQIAVLFLKKHGETPKRELHNKLLDCEAILKGQGEKEKELKRLRVLGNNREHQWSPETIGNFVHGGAIPNRVEIIRAWDSIAPLLKKMLDQL